MSSPPGSWGTGAGAAEAVAGSTAGLVAFRLAGATAGLVAFRLAGATAGPAGLQPGGATDPTRADASELLVGASVLLMRARIGRPHLAREQWQAKPTDRPPAAQDRG
jgi:hypothetical protein